MIEIFAYPAGYVHRHRIKNPYKSIRWRKFKNSLIAERGRACELCGRTPEKSYDFHVHHKSYVFGRDICDYPESNFICVCVKCHGFVHSNVGIAQGYFTP